MAQAKRKTATKTKKKPAVRKAKSCQARKTCAKKTCISSQERMHIYIVTAMGMIAGILLCADVAMMIA